MQEGGGWIIWLQCTSYCTLLESLNSPTPRVLPQARTAASACTSYCTLLESLNFPAPRVLPQAHAPPPVRFWSH
ncbi:hypothetical protein T492DRAFT_1021344 [Pavlovales sp. CCMP2436]|nr:hypothetical protein T492DRAFT_1021344 [Pavlovales sp. CCMP2436]